MTRGTYHTRAHPKQSALRWNGYRLVRALILLSTLLVAGCQPAPARPNAAPPPQTATSAAEGAGRPSAEASGQAPLAPGSTSPDGGAAIAATSPVALIDVPILGTDLAAGWDTQHSWAAQFAKSQDGAPAGTAAWAATFTKDNGGLFFAVKQDSSRRYLAANYVGARVWINPGSRDLAADRLSAAILTSDRRTYWSQDDEAVPPADPVTAGEGRPLLAGGALPAGSWTEVQIWFGKLPSGSHGRYLTGLYLRVTGMAGQGIRVAGLGLLAIPDDVPPVPFAASIIDLNSLRVTFNKDVDPVTAENAANYRIASPADPALSTPRTPSSVQYNPNGTSAVLTVPQALKPGVDYTVEVQGIADLAPQPHTQASATRLAFTAQTLVVQVEIAHPSHPISPLIYGIADGSPAYLKSLRPTLLNWGGNPSTRYNWQLGNAWNAGSDWEYRNGSYNNPPGSVSDEAIRTAQAAGAEFRLTLPTLGWVAKNTDNNTCSFVDATGNCYNPGATCAKPGPVADPNRANVPSDVNSTVEWVKHMQANGLPVQLFAFDNEPELWGYTHYDVHPNCTTYDEILSKYLTYASAVRAIAPEAELLGPSTCCWYFYWNSAAGQPDKAAHANQDFLPWFLDQVRQHDEKSGVRTLDALDIHYYPEGFYNDKTDPATAQGRLQETRSLWDKSYVDPSWIGQPVNLIPRMKQIIADNYPGTKLFISEWNFGADKTMNGALALADVLGTYGQEDVYGASYWRAPDLNSPGFFGFKMYTNYDDQGSHFGDTALSATSSNRDQVSVYASRDSKTGNVLLMLINKAPDSPIPVTLQMAGATGGQATLFRYSQDHLDGITRQSVAMAANSTITLPPYSITLLVVPD